MLVSNVFIIITLQQILISARKFLTLLSSKQSWLYLVFTFKYFLINLSKLMKSLMEILTKIILIWIFTNEVTVKLVDSHQLTWYTSHALQRYFQKFQQCFTLLHKNLSYILLDLYEIPTSICCCFEWALSSTTFPYCLLVSDKNVICFANWSKIWKCHQTLNVTKHCYYFLNFYIDYLEIII